MGNAQDGMNYEPKSNATPVVAQPGEFVFAAAYFDHGHIYGQIGGLAAAGGTLKYVYDPQPERYKKTLEEYPGAKAVSNFREILDDPEVRLVTSAAIPSERCEVGLRVLDAGKHYLTDKSPFTTLDQLERARAKVKETGKKYAVCYSERLLSESGMHAGVLIEQGAVGRVLQVLNLAPHNLAAHTRPDWFFRKEKYGGILTDIGSHQFEQFLTYTGASDATLNFARVDNFENPDTPGLEDFGEASLTTDNGASCYCRLDWFNPKASRTWGDGRTFVLGTKGYLEIRKYVDVCNGDGGKIFLVNDEVEQMIECEGRIGFPYFSRLIRDILDGTEKAMTQAHAFKAAELSMRAQRYADERRSN